MTSAVNKNRICATFAMIAVIGFCYKIRSSEMTQFQGQALGAKFNIKYISDDSIKVEEVSDFIEKFFIDLQNKTSLYQKGSELIRINRAPAARWIPISHDLGFIISYALNLSRITDGYYDITTGSLTKIWAMDSLLQVEPDVPRENELIKARINVGYNKVKWKINDNIYYLYKDHQNIVIDLASLTAGFAADGIARYLDSIKIKNYMVDVGGEFLTSGTNKGKDWIIGIEDPFVPSGKNVQTVALNNMAMATSGSYKNFIKQKNIRYSHIMNPHTGKPVVGNLISVSVLQKKCMEADALATAIFAMGESRGYHFAASNHIPVFMVVLNQKGIPMYQFTAEMKKYLLQ